MVCSKWYVVVTRIAASVETEEQATIQAQHSKAQQGKGKKDTAAKIKEYVTETRHKSTGAARKIGHSTRQNKHSSKAKTSRATHTRTHTSVVYSSSHIPYRLVGNMGNAQLMGGSQTI